MRCDHNARMLALRGSRNSLVKLYVRGTIIILTERPLDIELERPLDKESERPSDKELERRSDTLQAIFFESKKRDISVWCEATSKHMSSIKENRLTGYKVGDTVYLVIYSSRRCETWTLWYQRGQEE